MNEKQAKERVAEIAKLAHNPERAHELEDWLYRDFIKFVAERDDELGRVARVVLSVQDLDFAHWYA